jgi:hypothetical protein
MAEDAEILSKFEKLVNQLNSASLALDLVTSNRSNIVKKLLELDKQLICLALALDSGSRS